MARARRLVRLWPSCTNVGSLLVKSVREMSNGSRAVSEIDILPSMSRWRKLMLLSTRDETRPWGTSRAGVYETEARIPSPPISVPETLPRTDQWNVRPEMLVELRLLASRSSPRALRLTNPPQPLTWRIEAGRDAPYDSCVATFSQVVVETPFSSTVRMRAQSFTTRR